MKKILSAILVIVICLGAVSVGAGAVGLANPWTDADPETIEAETGFSLWLPETVEYTCSYREGLAQASWSYAGVSVTERIHAADTAPAMDSDTLTLLSGVYFTGLQTQSKELTVGGRCPGYMEFCKGDLGAIMWYDETLGAVYTLSYDIVYDPRYLGDLADTVTPFEADGADDTMLVIDGCAIRHDLTAVPVADITDESDFLWCVVSGFGITYTDADGVVWGIYRAGQAGVFEIVVSSEDTPSPWTVDDQIWVGGSKLVELCVADGRLTHILTDELEAGAAYDVELR